MVMLQMIDQGLEGTISTTRPSQEAIFLAPTQEDPKSSTRRNLPHFEALLGRVREQTVELRLSQSSPKAPPRTAGVVAVHPHAQAARRREDAPDETTRVAVRPAAAKRSVERGSLGPEPPEHRPQRPCSAARAKKYKKCHGATRPTRAGPPPSGGAARASRLPSARALAFACSAMVPAYSSPRTRPRAVPAASSCGPVLYRGFGFTSSPLH